MDKRVAVGLAGLTLLVLYASVAYAQIEGQLQAYTGRNAGGYLAPLVQAMGTDLTSGQFHSARIPLRGVHASLEFSFMTVFFGERSRSFVATTEGDFAPTQSTAAPTVIGPTEVVYVEGNAGTQFAFPGGFDVDNLPFAAPQLRLGSWHGTEAVFRYLFFDTGDAILGDLSLYGVGARHNLSQYLGESFPADVALAALWQSASLGTNERGNDLIASDSYSVGLQASRQFGNVTPYAGIALDWFSMDVSYVYELFDESESIDLSFEENADVHYTLGVSYSLAFVNAFGEYNLANQNALAVGLAFQYTSSDRSVGP